MTMEEAERKAARREKAKKIAKASLAVIGTLAVGALLSQVGYELWNAGVFDTVTKAAKPATASVLRESILKENILKPSIIKENIIKENVVQELVTKEIKVRSMR